MILLLPFGSVAQKKTKKGVYDEYWKQQDQMEKFDLKSKEAHKQFQDGKLKLALLTYNEALKLNPKDQKTIAKIRDIKILLQKKDTEKLIVEQLDTIKDTIHPEMVVPSIVYLKKNTVFLESNAEEEEVQIEIEVEPKPITESNPPAKDTLIIAKIKPKATLKKQSVPQKKEEVKPVDKPYKNTENFRKYLATLYKEGWTEEKLDEKNKKIVKRVHVYGDRGDEYQQVTHHYGAVFYFKNGLSITYGTWVNETKEMK